MDVGHIDAFLDALTPPVAAFANRHDLQLVQTVGVEEVIDAGELLLVAAHMLAHHLVEAVVLVGILFTLSWTALLQQVAQLHRLDVYIFIMLLSSPPLTSTYRIKSLYIFLRNQ